MGKQILHAAIFRTKKTSLTGQVFPRIYINSKFYEIQTGNMRYCTSLYYLSSKKKKDSRLQKGEDCSSDNTKGWLS